MLGALSDKEAAIQNLAPGQDVQGTLRCLQALGVQAEFQKDKLILKGSGPHGFQPARVTLDAGNSGTTIRLLSGLLAGQSFVTAITGDHSLRKRDMQRIIDPLTRMGAEIDSLHGCAPLKIRGGRLTGITYQMPVASSQVKSSILLAGLLASGTTTVIEPAPTRDHTERMLQYLEVPVKTKNSTIQISGGSLPKSRDFTIPGDFSSAAFFIGAAVLVSGSKLRLLNVGMNPTRTKFLDVLKAMGGSVSVKNQQVINCEPRADLEIGSKDLTAVEIEKADIPLLIDELPLLAVMASQAKGATLIRNAGELRKKESDRISSVVTNLKKMGVQVEEFEDGMRIHGPAKLQGAALGSFHDHRIAMSFAVAGLIAQGETVLEGTEWVDISFPGFFELLQTLTEKPP